MLPRLPTPLFGMMTRGCGPSGRGLTYVPPLDAITSKLLVAMSLRRLFTGNAEGLQVRESVGSTNADIGTLATGPFDADAFNTHIGAGSGFARTAYDQKGTKNFNNTTAANQPAVTLNAIGTRAGLTYDSTDFLIDTAGVGTAIGTGDFELWIVAKPSSLAANKGIAVLGGLVYFYTSVAGNGKAGVYCSAGEKDFNLAVSINTAHLLRLYRVSGTVFCEVDGTTAPNSWSSTDNLQATGVQYRWGPGGGETFAGVMAEFLLLNGSLSTGERDALMADIAAYFGITVA